MLWLHVRLHARLACFARLKMAYLRSSNQYSRLSDASYQLVSSWRRSKSASKTSSRATELSCSLLALKCLSTSLWVTVRSALSSSGTSTLTEILLKRKPWKGMVCHSLKRNKTTNTSMQTFPSVRAPTNEASHGHASTTTGSDGTPCLLLSISLTTSRSSSTDWRQAKERRRASLTRSSFLRSVSADATSSSGRRRTMTRYRESKQSLLHSMERSTTRRHLR